MKVAFVYDRLNKIGGAERILTALHLIWPDAPFYTSVYRPHSAAFAKDWSVKTSFMQLIPLAKSRHELYPWLTPFAFETFSFDQYDVVISITSAEAKGIITRPETLHLCYCLTPTRYLWSHTATYANSGSPLLRPLKRFLLTRLRLWDQIAAQRPDKYLAISQTVQKRIRKYYHRPSQIIYPPLDTKFFKPISSDKSLTTNYFLTVSRLVSYKNIELAVKTLTKLKLPLVVVGVGNKLSQLKTIAGSNIQFVGELTDEKLLSYYQGCQALIFPADEDFGLTMLEAQSVGKPVIAFRKGGATEIIEEGQSGVFFGKLTIPSLTQAINKLQATKFDSQKIRSRVIKFDTQYFKQRFRKTINNLWQTHQKNLQ